MVQWRDVLYNMNKVRWTLYHMLGHLGKRNTKCNAKVADLDPRPDEPCFFCHNQIRFMKKLGFGSV